MPLELRLRFPDPEKVIVELNDEGDIESAAPMRFKSPIDFGDAQEIRWYLEIYPVHYTNDVDDIRARDLEKKLDGIGASLFDSIFYSRETCRLFNRFQDAEEEGRLLTIDSDHPVVLAQPWELLRDPTGSYLFLERHRISIRRRLAGAGGGRKPPMFSEKNGLHLLFVVSRPTEANFINHRSDPLAVMDAIEMHAWGRITVEFLRPPTLICLLQRLEDTKKPQVDILHFDGHGVYDSDGRLSCNARQVMLSAGLEHVQRAGQNERSGQGYVLFESAEGTDAIVSADTLGKVLHRQRVGLVVLSACQSAAIGGEDPMGCVAARLTHAGIPAVIAMTYSVLVDTTRTLFGAFYTNLLSGRSIGFALDNARRELYLQPERGVRQRGDTRAVLSLQDWFVPALYQAGADSALLSAHYSADAPVPQKMILSRPPEPGFFGRTRELWLIERWFLSGTRRVVIHGLGGQGKTALAQEVGRWLQRTDIFQRVCFITFANFQGVDPVGAAISGLAMVIEEDLLDVGAATAALRRTNTLVILDNIESLDQEPLLELLDAASAWSDAGQSRVLMTTRRSTLDHHAYPNEGSHTCRYMRLNGLESDDALARLIHEGCGSGLADVA